MRRPRSIITLLAASAAAAAALPIVAVAGPGAAAPDLRADRPEGVSEPEVYSGPLAPGRLLVRFDGFVTNVGQGPLEVSGNPSAGTMRQLARVGPVGSAPTLEVGRPPVRYETADGHDHWHLMRAMRYSLWNAERTAQVAPAQKVGFCLYDSERASGAPVTDPQAYPIGGSADSYCQQGSPGATSLRMGTSAGWRDVYDKALPLQWVDVSDTAPGRYAVAAEADPDGVIWEGGGAREANPAAFADEVVVVPGWVAQPVSLPQTGATQPVTLSAAGVGGVAESRRRFRIVTPPQHGSLSRAAGEEFSAGTVTYTPAPGYRGPDGFTYVARDADSRFPLNPPAAAVTLADTTVRVAVSGVPASVRTGTSVQLGATVTNGSSGVTWSVNGIPQGDAAVGTITPTGLYSAPTAVPAAGAVTVRATSVDDPASYGEARIAIAAAPRARSAALPRGYTASANTARLRLLVGRGPNRAVLARVTAKAHGRLTVAVIHRRTVAGRCTLRVARGRTVTCRVVLTRSMRPADVRVVAVLRMAGGRRATVRTPLLRRR